MYPFMCPCWYSIQLYYYNNLLTDPDGGEAAAFPSGSEPVIPYTPPIAGVPNLYKIMSGLSGYPLYHKGGFY
jgi:hypothetical protein